MIENDLDANADFKAIRMIDGKPMEFGFTNVEFANDLCPHIRFAFAVLDRDRDGLIEVVRGLATDPASGGDARLVYDLCEDWHTTERQLTTLAEIIRVAGTRAMLVMQALCEEGSPAGKALAKGTEVHIPQYIRERADARLRPEGGVMIDKIIALFEALTAADLEQARPVDLERFAALCRHWASLADLSREARCGRPG